AILGGFFLFNSQATPSKVEHKAQAALQKRFPGAQVQVHVEGKRGTDVLHGKFKTVQINLGNLGRINGLPLLPADNARHQGHVGHFELQMRDFIWNDLPLELASFSFDDLSYDLDALKKDALLKLVHSGPSSARLVVPAVSLEAVVRTRIQDIQNPHVTVRGNTITIEGKKPLPLVEVPVPFTLTANLEAHNGGEVWLTHPQVKMVDVPVGPTIGNSLVGHVNPIYVFDREHKWPFRVNITNIHAQNNKLQLDADLPFIKGH
ncbi:MAG: LmeA family phospholipid-binding protein, partial [Abitibacteriaceae bacterium]|nr:LmeA family phospholipid-binding protein [Abditibacteriaceae bacterium]